MRVVGKWVSVASGPALEALLHRPGCPRPEPEQYLHAGQRAQIVAAVREPDGSFRYRLAGLPGVWREEWLAPA